MTSNATPHLPSSSTPQTSSSSSSSSMPQTSSSSSLYSEKLYELRQHQQEIQNWLNLVNRKIEDLEDSYLSETNLGNIVRGWDIDGKSQRFYKGPSDEKDPGTIKEKIFSCSSYEMWFENKVQSETEKLEHHAYGLKNSNFKSNKRHRKSLMARKDDPDYGQSGDY